MLRCSQLALVVALVLATGLLAQNEPLPKGDKPQGGGQNADGLPAGALMRLGGSHFQHAGSVFGLAFLPDGKMLASASLDGSIRLWEVETGKELRWFECPEHPLETWALSPDGDRVAWGSEDGTAVVWETRTGKELVRIKGPRTRFDRRASGMAFTPDGKVLATTGIDATVRFWDVSTGKEVRQFTGHAEPVAGIVFSADGKLLATGSRDQKVRLWETATGREVRRLDGHQNGVWSVAFSGDGKLLVSAEYSRDIRFWDVATGKELGKTTGNAPAVLAPDGKTVAFIQGIGYGVECAEVPSGKKLERLPGAMITGLAFSIDGKTFAAGNQDGKIRMSDVASRKLLPVSQENGAMQGLALSPDGLTLATGDPFGLSLWDTATGKERLREEDKKGVSGLAYSPDGKVLYTAGYGNVTFRDAATAKPLDSLKVDAVGRVALTRDGKMLAVRQVGPFVGVIDTAQRKKLYQIQAWNHMNVEAFAFTPDGKTLAGLKDSSAVTFWDTASGKEVGPPLAPSAGALVFAPDGRTLAAGLSQTVQLWDWPSARLRSGWKTNHTSDLGLVYSPDGRALASWGEDRKEPGNLGKTLYLWETATGGGRAKFAGHSDRITEVVFSPDGRRLFSASKDGTVLVWDLRPSPAKEEATDERLRQWWDDLASQDAAKAYSALWSLAAVPDRGVKFVADRLKPAGPIDRRVARLIDDLGGDQFARREAAVEELARLGKDAAEGLRRALDKAPSPEVRTRLERLLENHGGPHPTAEDLRGIRALECLECLGGPEAKSLLGSLAGGAQEARLTREAKATLERLSGR